MYLLNVNVKPLNTYFKKVNITAVYFFCAFLSKLGNYLAVNIMAQPHNFISHSGDRPGQVQIRHKCKMGGNLIAITIKSR